MPIKQCTTENGGRGWKYGDIIDWTGEENENI